MSGGGAPDAAARQGAGAVAAAATTATAVDLAEMAADVVCAYVAHNQVPAADLPGLLVAVHGTLAALTSPPPAPEARPPVPAVPVGKSVANDYIACLGDGRRFKSPKRHLRTAFGMTPAEYRAKWGLPADYPMVAPAYAEARSTLARQMGLGRMRRCRGADASSPSPARDGAGQREAGGEADAPPSVVPHETPRAGEAA